MAFLINSQHGRSDFRGFAASWILGPGLVLIESGPGEFWLKERQLVHAVGLAPLAGRVLGEDESNTSRWTGDQPRTKHQYGNGFKGTCRDRRFLYCIPWLKPYFPEIGHSNFSHCGSACHFDRRFFKVTWCPRTLVQTATLEEHLLNCGF